MLIIFIEPKCMVNSEDRSISDEKGIVYNTLDRKIDVVDGHEYFEFFLWKGLQI